MGVPVRVSCSGLLHDAIFQGSIRLLGAKESDCGYGRGEDPHACVSEYDVHGGVRVHAHVHGCERGGYGRGCGQDRHDGENGAGD